MSDTPNILTQVLTEAAQRNAQRGGDEPKHYDFEIFGRYCSLCEAIGTPPLPVSVPNATAYLLMRGAQGAIDAELSEEMRFIANFHLLCDAQIRPYGDIRAHSFHEWNKALGYAQQKFNGRVPAPDLPLANRCKAFEMFPNGVIPRRIEDIAA